MLNLTSGIFATVCMTGISYILSRIYTKNFREPELLQKVLFGTNSDPSAKLHVITSWLVHLAIGCLLAVSINFIWINEILRLTMANSIIVGIGVGVFAVLCWLIFLFLRKIFHIIESRFYYVQLVLVHIIFTIIVTGFYRLW